MICETHKPTLLNFKRQKYDFNGKRGAEKGAQCVQMSDKRFLLESETIVCYISVSDGKNIRQQHDLNETIQ